MIAMFSENEEKIIERFYDNLDEFDNKKMLLIWNDGSKIFANFDTCFEDDNELEMDDENYEEFCSFIFEVLAVEGNPPVHISEANFCLINYHNFPDTILADGQKIN